MAKPLIQLRLAAEAAKLNILLPPE